MTPLIKCRCCDGTGKVGLSGDMLSTLSAVAWDSWRDTSDITARIGSRFVGKTAINNRLRALEKYGVIRSERRGKPIYWRRVKK